MSDEKDNVISDGEGKMFEVIMPDYSGNLPWDGCILSTPGQEHLFVNLLTGALRIISGAR